MKKILMVFASVMSAMVVGAETIDVTQANIESHRMLQNGNTYLFAENIDFTASACLSAMTVADGATVTLNIAANVAVTLKGGAAAAIWA